MIPLDFLHVRTRSGIGKKHLPGGPRPQGPVDPLEAQGASGRDTRDEVTWIIKATGVRPNGTTGSATNSLTRAGTDAYVWRSTDRVVGDERQPPMEVKVVRKPPPPKTPGQEETAEEDNK